MNNLTGADIVDLGARLDEYLNRLKWREREILKLRFGIGGSVPRTLRQTAMIFKVTQERIRQIQMTAMDNLAGLIAKDKIRKEEPLWNRK